MNLINMLYQINIPGWNGKKQRCFFSRRFRHHFTFAVPVTSIEANQGPNANRNSNELDGYPERQKHFLKNKI